MTVQVKMLKSASGVNDGNVYATHYEAEGVYTIGFDLAQAFTGMGVCEILATLQKDDEPVMEAPKELKAMKVDELRALAIDLGIEFDETAKKADLIEAISAAKGE